MTGREDGAGDVAERARREAALADHARQQRACPHVGAGQPDGDGRHLIEIELRRGAQCADYRCHFYDLGPGADDAEDFLFHAEANLD